MTRLVAMLTALVAAVSADIAIAATRTEGVGCGDINVPGTGANAGFRLITSPKVQNAMRVSICGWDFKPCPDIAIVRGSGPHALSWDGTTLTVHGRVDPIKLTKRILVMDNHFASVKYSGRMPGPGNVLWLDRRNCRASGPIVGM
jgi:hypothetical protein